MVSQWKRPFPTLARALAEPGSERCMSCMLFFEDSTGSGSAGRAWMRSGMQPRMHVVVVVPWMWRGAMTGLMKSQKKPLCTETSRHRGYHLLRPAGVGEPPSPFWLLE